MFVLRLLQDCLDGCFEQAQVARMSALTRGRVTQQQPASLAGGHMLAVKGVCMWHVEPHKSTVPVNFLRAWSRESHAGHGCKDVTGVFPGWGCVPCMGDVECCKVIVTVAVACTDCGW